MMGGTWSLAATEGGEVGGRHSVEVTPLLHGAHLGWWGHHGGGYCRRSAVWGSTEWSGAVVLE